MLRSLPLLALVSIGLGGCPEGPPVRSALRLRAPEDGPATDDPPPASTEPPPSSALARQMHQRLATVTRIRQATIRGDLPGAKKAGAELTAALAAAPPPEVWRPYLRAIAGELEVLEHADDLRAVGQAIARLGLGCGRCHEAGSIVVALPQPPSPQPGKDFDSSMRVHRWAAARMWEGLVVPSGDRWIRGSTMFIEIPGCPPATTEAEQLRQALCNDAQSLARRGHVTESLPGRAAVYGRLLTTCAQCHTATRADGTGA